MRKLNAKQFDYMGEKCYRIGDVEMYASELQKAHDEGKYWILTRTKAMYTNICDDGNGGTVVKYENIPTRTRENTLPHRYFVMSWNEIKDYIANESKVWRIEFETVEKALEEEYIARHEGDLNVIVRKTYSNSAEAFLLIECDPMAEKIVPQWYGEKAKISYMDANDVKKLFHPTPYANVKPILA